MLKYYFRIFICLFSSSSNAEHQAIWALSLSLRPCSQDHNHPFHFWLFWLLLSRHHQTCWVPFQSHRFKRIILFSLCFYTVLIHNNSETYRRSRINIPIRSWPWVKDGICQLITTEYRVTTSFGLVNSSSLRCYYPRHIFLQLFITFLNR